MSAKLEQKTTVDATAGRSGSVLRRVGALAAFLAVLFVALVAASFTAAPTSAQSRDDTPTPTNTSEPPPATRPGSPATPATPTPALRLVISPTSLSLGQGSNGTFTVKLSSEPGGDIAVSVSSENTNRVSAVPSSLTFTSGNWNAAQTVTLYTSISSTLVNQTINIDLSASGSGHTATGRVSVTILAPTPTNTPTPTPTPTPPHLVIPSSLELVDNKGATPSPGVWLTVRLSSAPNGNVTVQAASSDSSLVQVAGTGNRLTFTTQNWNTDQRFFLIPGSPTGTPTSGASRAGRSAEIQLSAKGGGYNTAGAVTITLVVAASTPTPTPMNTSMPPPPPGGNTPAPGNTSMPPPPPGGNTPAPGNTSMPPPPPGGNTPAPTRPGGGGGGGSAPQAGAWVAPGMVKHAGAPAQVFGSSAALHFYFVGPGGVQSGPVVPSVSELAKKHPKGSPVVTLWTGTNPLTGKAVRIEYLPGEEKVLYTTAYEDKYYKRDKLYVFTISKDGKVTHRAW